MSKSKRKFQPDEKLQILREGETNGVDITCRKYQIARSLFYNLYLILHPTIKERNQKITAYILLDK
jgi:hypothetical protein